ncbi:signal peptidase I [endosymbiont of Sipalinus gigas]|nr:signal peptidase I [endosymbiont of Sipalinus gigas]BBA85202.1 signal peptidase I [endosymbiont of Sipalinus gigas]
MINIILLFFFIFNYFLYKKYNLKLYTYIIKKINEFKYLLYIIILSFFIKKFLYELFYISSNSMFPTLSSGDIVLVKKNSKYIKLNNLKRGDLIVFKFPIDNKKNYIKRIIGLPKDKIIYNRINKKIIVKFNNNNYIKYYNYNNINSLILDKIKNLNLNSNLDYKNFKIIKEKIGNCEYDILIYKKQIDFLYNYYLNSNKKNTVEWIVPEGAYFVLGDNRDNSFDSRYWGFVKKKLLIGKVKFILFNIKEVYKILIIKNLKFIKK